MPKMVKTYLLKYVRDEEDGLVDLGKEYPCGVCGHLKIRTTKGLRVAEESDPDWGWPEKIGPPQIRRPDGSVVIPCCSGCLTEALWASSPMDVFEFLENYINGEPKKVAESYQAWLRWWFYEGDRSIETGLKVLGIRLEDLKNLEVG